MSRAPSAAGSPRSSRLLPQASEGYHIGGRSQSNYNVSATALQQQGITATGYVSTINWLFAWC